MKYFLITLLSVATMVVAQAQPVQIEDVKSGCNSSQEECENSVSSYITQSVFTRGLRAEKSIQRITDCLCADELPSSLYQVAVIEAASHMRIALATRVMSIAAGKCDQAKDAIGQVSDGLINRSSQQIIYVPSPS